MTHHTSWAGRGCVLLAAVLATAFSAGCPGEESPDIAAIRQTVAQIDKANQSSDGEAAASLITASSIASYGRRIDAALHAKRADVERLDSWDQMEVFRIRMRATPAQIEGLDPRGYVVFATSQGWYVDPEFEETKLDKINVKGDAATAQVTVEGESFLVKFKREDGVWKFDEESWRGPFNRLIAEEAGDDLTERAEFVLAIVEDEIGTDAPDSIWQPMINPVGAFKPGG